MLLSRVTLEPRAILPYFKVMAPFGKLLDRLARSPEETRAEDCNHWARSVSGAQPIGQVEPRERIRVAGLVRNIRIDPREGTGSVEATIFDGTGEIVAKWLGRSSLSGVKLGAGLILEGIAGTGNDDRLVVLNPEYELVPGPEHG
jgi:hypothetical protein